MVTCPSAVLENAVTTATIIFRNLRDRPTPFPKEEMGMQEKKLLCSTTLVFCPDPGLPRVALLEVAHPLRAGLVVLAVVDVPEEHRVHTGLKGH